MPSGACKRERPPEASSSTESSMSDAINKNRVLDLTRRYVAPHRVEVWDAFGTQLVMGRREGYHIWDLDGHELIDLHLNGGTFNLGHRNPEIIEAMVAAAAELAIGKHHSA